MVKTVFDVPRIIFTLKGNKKSEEVVQELVRLQEANEVPLLNQEYFRRYGVEAQSPSILDDDLRGRLQEYAIFDSPEAIRARFESGLSPLAAVVLFDYHITGHFKPGTQSRSDDQKVIPQWACGAQWAVKIGSACDLRRCANQLRADFNREFRNRLALNRFPWGLPRKGEEAPNQVLLPQETKDLIFRLNEGPNLAAAIADETHRMELPVGSRISWLRVVPEPVRYDEKSLQLVLGAFEKFERACSGLLRTSNAGVRAALRAGVEMNGNEQLFDLYLSTEQEMFSVRRPDLHHTEQGVFASENDEMPGGFPELVHIDHVYGLNRQRWQRCFSWMTERGPLLFVVSHKWSSCYKPEMEWLVEHLRSQGYPVDLLTTDRLGELSVSGSGVRYRGTAVGTVWRQFPIFETRGKLADLVVAAHEGVVRMIPEFAHFGNKAWFSLFRSYEDFFRKALCAETMAILDEVLPDSHLVISEDSFPFTVLGNHIEDFEGLRSLPPHARNGLVLKVSGANALTARSYGVLMGHGLSQQTWRQWIDERMRLRQPFIIQRRVETAVASIPVYHTGRRCGELFGCRVLLRPWMFNGELVSVHGCAVPANTLRVHGRVDMAVLPVLLE